MTIHKEGYVSLALATVVLGGINLGLNQWLTCPCYQWILCSVGTISVILFLIVLQFFRSPKRTTVINPKHIIAPADGKVVVIEETVEHEYFKGPRRQVSIFMSPFNVHSNRNPVSGVVKFFKYHPGLFLVAWHPKSSTDNERTTAVVETESGHEILFRQIAGALARRIVWYIKEGDKVKQGEEYGFIKFGSRIDIFLPLDAKILVNLGDKPVGGETVIAELV
jgi:phosphatidylserine decarboxylase